MLFKSHLHGTLLSSILCLSGILVCSMISRMAYLRPQMMQTSEIATLLIV